MALLYDFDIMLLKLMVLLKHTKQCCIQVFYYTKCDASENRILHPSTSYTRLPTTCVTYEV